MKYEVAAEGSRERSRHNMRGRGRVRCMVGLPPQPASRHWRASALPADAAGMPAALPPASWEASCACRAATSATLSTLRDAGYHTRRTSERLAPGGSASASLPPPLALRCAASSALPSGTPGCAGLLGAAAPLGGGGAPVVGAAASAAPGGASATAAGPAGCHRCHHLRCCRSRATLPASVPGTAAPCGVAAASHPAGSGLEAASLAQLLAAMRPLPPHVAADSSSNATCMVVWSGPSTNTGISTSRGAPSAAPAAAAAPEEAGSQRASLRGGG